MIGFFAFLIFLLPALLFLMDERTTVIAMAPAIFISSIFAVVFYRVATDLREAFGGASKNKPVVLDVKSERPPSELVLILQSWFPNFDDVALCRIPEAILNWALLSGIIFWSAFPFLPINAKFAELYRQIVLYAALLFAGIIVLLYEWYQFRARKKKA